MIIPLIENRSTIKRTNLCRKNLERIFLRDLLPFPRLIAPHRKIRNTNFLNIDNDRFNPATFFHAKTFDILSLIGFPLSYSTLLLDK